jgi:hypothetical protein
MGEIGEFAIKPGVIATIENGPNEITSYANLVGMVFGVDDVLLHFALRTEGDPTKAVGVAKIYLSLPHAKRIVTALKNGLEQIEKLVGEIVEDPAGKYTPEELQELLKPKTGG